MNDLQALDNYHRFKCWTQSFWVCKWCPMVLCACWDQGIHEGGLDSFNEGCWGLFSSVILDVEDFGKVSATGLDVADLHQPVLDPADGGGVSKDSLKETIWAVGSYRSEEGIQICSDLHSLDLGCPVSTLLID